MLHFIFTSTYYIIEVTEDDPSEVVKSKFQPSSKAGAHGRCVPLIDVDGHQCYPFQVQIEYTGHDGSRLMKVFTKTKQETSEKAVAEKGMLCTLLTQNSYFMWLFMTSACIRVSPKEALSNILKCIASCTVTVGCFA